MKKLSAILILVVFILASCQKEGLREDKEFNGMTALDHNSYVVLDSRQETGKMPEFTVAKNGIIQEQPTGKMFCNELIYGLFGGQTIPAGNIVVSNDFENLYVTYQADEGWKIKEIHLYAGTFENIPLNNANVPVPGQFPIKESFNPAIETVTYEIPLASLPECPYVLAHAVVGRDGQEETAWGKGDTSFEDAFDIKRWGWVIEYCVKTCDKEGVTGLKSYVVDKNKTDAPLWWVVAKGPGTDVNCLGFGFNTFNTGETNSSVYDLIKWGNIDDKVGTMTVFTTTEGNIKFLNIVIDLTDDNLAFSKTYLYAGSEAGLVKYHYMYENKDCFKFYEWFFRDDNVVNTKTFKIPLKDIKEK